MEQYVRKRAEKMEKKSLIGKVYRECAAVLGTTVLLFTCTELLTGIFGVVTANTLGTFADAAFNLDFSLGFENVIRLLCCLCIVVFVSPGLGLLTNFIMLGKTLKHDEKVFERFFEKKLSAFKKMNAGEIQYELEDAPNTLRLYWINIVGKGCSLIVCFGYLLYCGGKISWTLTGSLLGITVLKLIVPAIMKKQQAEYDRQEKEYKAKRRGYENDIALKPYIIKQWGISNAFISRLDTLYQTYYKESEKKKISCDVLAEQLEEFMNHATMAAFLFAGAYLIAIGKVSPGELTVMIVYMSLVQSLFTSLGEIVKNYPLMTNAANRVAEFYQDAEPEKGTAVETFQEISGEKLSFAYDEKVILDKLDFSVKAGEKIGIWGENGRGKSTLMKLLTAVLEDYKGMIKVNGNDLQTIQREDWYEMLAYAPQNPYLISTTVRENISLDKSVQTKEKVDQMLKDFGIAYLADRELTMDAELSGGEKQKISLIRAFAKKAEVLLLDEPTNHLDQDSIEVLKNYLRSTDKTVILISHDSSLSEVVDRNIRL